MRGPEPRSARRGGGLFIPGTGSGYAVRFAPVVC